MTRQTNPAIIKSYYWRCKHTNVSWTYLSRATERIDTKKYTFFYISHILKLKHFSLKIRWRHIAFLFRGGEKRDTKSEPSSESEKLLLTIYLLFFETRLFACGNLKLTQVALPFHLISVTDQEKKCFVILWTLSKHFGIKSLFCGCEKKEVTCENKFNRIESERSIWGKDEKHFNENRINLHDFLLCITENVSSKADK